jgi:hypothetical protein
MVNLASIPSKSLKAFSSAQLIQPNTTWFTLKIKLYNND